MSAIIRRDWWGIPHLWGDTVDELAYAQGRAAALDRAWQLEVERWRSEGRLRRSSARTRWAGTKFESDHAPEP